MKSFLFYSICLLWLVPGFGNNLFVSGVVLKDQDRGTRTTTVQFDIRWNNSWRFAAGPANWDAAWFFVKYQADDGPWRHATLTAATRIPNGAAIDIATDTRGGFIYRNAPGAGNVLFSDVEISWDYGTDQVADNAVILTRVYAIEMVYIPEESFFLGTGGTEPGAFYEVQADAAARTPYRITSEAPISVGTAVDNLYYEAVSFSGDRQGPVPADYPKGFADFYCMKYEVTQEEFVECFNTLTPTQRQGMDVTDASGKNTDAETNRNGISWTGNGEATTSHPAVPIAFLTAARSWAYLDWSGLRPMSEMEYEKSCRGPLDPIPNEYVWGNRRIHAGRYDESNPGTINEVLSGLGAATGNAIYGPTVPGGETTGGPARVGSLAASAANATRQETGASYYGVMELAGNLYELCVSVGDATGRAFRRQQHGDGVLNSNGTTDEPNWPSATAGSGFHGGGFYNAADRMEVSYRTFSAYNSSANGLNVTGFRGVRSN